MEVPACEHLVLLTGRAPPSRQAPLRGMDLSDLNEPMGATFPKKIEQGR